METFLVLLFAVLLFFVIILLVLGGIFFKIACARNGKLVSKIISEGSANSLSPYKEQIEKGRQKIENCKKQEVSIQSFDGLDLHALYLSGENPERTIICVHGYHSDPSHDFSIAVEPLLKHGNLLMIDQRAHGKSEGKFITFGVHEAKDCKAWAEWLLEALGEDHPVYFDGVSMGGTSVLLASGLDLPRNVRGIIADCSFTSPYEIIESLAQKTFNRTPRLLLSSIDLYCKIFASFSLKEASTPAAMLKNTRPILFAHGTGDSLVPYKMTQAAYDACNCEKYLVLAKDAEHGLSYVIDNARYSEAIQNLFAFCEKADI
ncbi:MAG: alpha/beta hydrolase [Ruminococcaceae bacterium]|nr:alpha/beta hydrolase [Oscillospiraceae bacterium]